jgi:hypothetical protein
MGIKAHEDPIPFWLAVEAFSPQSVPALSRSRDDVPFVGDYSPDQILLPWLPDAFTPECPQGKEWAHSVYLGVFDVESAWAVLPSQADDNPNATSGQSAILAMTVRQDGSFVDGSFVVSQCVWAVGKYLKNRSLDDVFSDFVTDEDDWKKQLDTVVVTNGISLSSDVERGVPNHPVDKDDLSDLFQAVVRLAGVGRALTLAGSRMGLRIESRHVSSRRNHDGENKQDFLNSFFSRDLYELSIQNQRPGPVRHYLGSPPAKNVDIGDNPEVVFDSVAPALIPDGRWPSDPTHALSLSQQFAVNRIFADLADSSDEIFAVNGPPGTGKTTMLREIVAGLVTRRARALAALANPADAFTPTRHSWISKSDRRRTIRELRESIRGAEMIIASSNNGAVENISLEIPGEGAIFEGSLEATDYFTSLATTLLSRGRDFTQATEKRAWGLMSGRLGSASNRSSFAATLMFGTGQSSEDTNKVAGLGEFLQGSSDDVFLPWKEARERFASAKATVDRLRGERQRLHDAYKQLPGLLAGAATIRAYLQKIADELRQADEGAERARDAWNKRLEEERKARADLQTHLSAKPNMIEQILTLGKTMKPWRAAQEKYSTKMLAASAACERAAEASAASDSIVSSTRANEQQKGHELQSIEGRVASIGAALKGYAPTGRLPIENWFSADNREKEKAAPWLDEEFNDARSRLFLAALDLHKSFIHDQRQVLKSNLFAAYDVLTSAAPSTASTSAVRAAWESLFLVVPTISTTFASLPRVFASLGAERLGWLLIDEAGQAAPQHALGGIWRTSKAVLVGDPLQLQPVVGLPIVHQQTLLRLTGISDRWLPGSNSAQALADRTCRYVARIEVPGSEEITVGAPLRVHRRCDNPMFDIVNNGVYGGMMVLAENDRKAFTIGESAAPLSAWFDASGERWNGHSSTDESILLSRLLEVLTASGYNMSKVLIVSPFRAVASDVRKLARRFGVDTKRQAGTIHTAQGKEADIVILVLGGQTPGARSWAASSPNLFNVAVSRARRRIYVIGNRRNWSILPYFQDLAAGVHHHEAGVDLERLFGRAS